MSQVSGTGTIWNLPNYSGILFTADAENTPFLSIIGGLNGGMETKNKQFPVSSVYDYPSAAQPAITETASLTAQTGQEAIRAQAVNTVQIHQQTIDLSYWKESNSGRMSGVNTAGQRNNAEDEMAFQIEWTMRKIARDVEYSFLQGTYQAATDATTAAKTRGMLAATSTNAVAAGSAQLSKDLMQELFRTMADGGSVFNDMIIFCGAYQKQKISDIYGYAPDDRNIGGVNIQQLETDFGKIGIVWDRFMPAASILAAEVSVCKPVFMPVPGKGNFFEEDLAKNGAADRKQIYGQIGLDHAAEFLHGKITGLATS
jgi:hypothetical protein